MKAAAMIAAAIMAILRIIAENMKVAKIFVLFPYPRSENRL